MYTSKGNIDINEIYHFLSNINLPRLSEEAVEMLEEEITLNEISEVVNNLIINVQAQTGLVQNMIKSFGRFLPLCFSV